MYGLIGFPLGHSFSARYFAKKFKRENINESYHLFEIPEISELPDLIYEHPDLNGLNVTIPYKREIFKYLDDISEDARAIGAVNVIKIERNCTGRKKKLIGFNSDWRGFSESLRPMLHDDVKKALVLGTGGASAAVVYALLQIGIEPTLVSRKPKENCITYNDLDENIMQSHLLIVNTTPLGMSPNTDTYPEIPYNLLKSRHICYDLVYNPVKTEFMKRSAESGACVKNGLEMLHLQAELSWKIWNGF